MTWLKVEDMQGFVGAEAVYTAGPWILAHWDHSKCRGWHLYRRVEKPRNQYQRQNWLMSGGIESLEWTDEQAQEWAMKQVAAFGE